MINNLIELPNGVLKQVDPQVMEYKHEYLDHYLVFEKEHSTELLGELRYNFIRDTIKHYYSFDIDRYSTKIIDIGFGIGYFLKYIKDYHPKHELFGYDVIPDYIPEGVKFIEDYTLEEYNIVTLFDTLEHIPNLDFLKELKTKFLVVSVPWLHSKDYDWIEKWRHYKPNEHLWYFDEISLKNLMEEYGYKMIVYTNSEDTLRGNLNGKPNILTAFFEKMDK